MLAVGGGIAAAALVGDGDDGNDGNGGDQTPDPTAESSFLAMAPADILRDSEKEMKVLDTVQVRDSSPTATRTCRST